MSLGFISIYNLVGSLTSEAPSAQGVEATEEEWEHRESMRAKAVAQCKASPEYQRCQRLRTPGADSEPLTPNHADRSISKRQWKFLLQRWRYEMQRYLEEHEVWEGLPSMHGVSSRNLLRDLPGSIVFRSVPNSNQPEQHRGVGLPSFMAEEWCVPPRKIWTNDQTCSVEIH
eukprot:s1710_g10.t1